jgi:hypothetical protein
VGRRLRRKGRPVVRHDGKWHSRLKKKERRKAVKVLE